MEGNIIVSLHNGSAKFCGNNAWCCVLEELRPFPNMVEQSCVVALHVIDTVFALYRYH